MESHAFLVALTTVLCVAAVVTVLFQKLRQPVVLGYVAGGLIVGPHLPIPLVADPEIVNTLSELGVILLLFALGLEFSLRKLAQLGATSALTTVIESSSMAWVGFVTGRLLGWSTYECLYAGAMVAISSTTIIAKAFDEQRVRGKVRDIVLGILIVEDLIAILLIALLTAISRGSGLSAGALAMTTLRFGAFLAALVVVGLLVVPRAVRAILRLHRPETTLVASIGICFATALLAQELGYALALGAFVAGALVAESGQAHQIMPLVRPLRDLFVAVFFVSVGMLIDPVVIAQHWRVVGLFVVVVIVGKACFASFGAFLAGNGIRSSLQTGMSLTQIGEISFVIAGVGVALNAIPESQYSIAVAVSAITTFTTPFLIRLSGPVADLVDRKLPHPVQTFASLYGTWFEQLRRAPQHRRRRGLPRLARLLLLDGAVVTGIVIAVAVGLQPLARSLQQQVGISAGWAQGLLLGTAFLVSLPFAVGIVRVAGRLGQELALIALPARHEGKLDLAAAPRRVLVLTLQIALVILIGMPLVAITQPFLRGIHAAIVLVVAIAGLAVLFWRRAADLEGHVRAGAELIAELLRAQSRSSFDASAALAPLEDLLPGIGKPSLCRLEPGSAAVGKSLDTLNLRGRTGATVLAIVRGEEGIIVPSADQTLVSGDVLALTGTVEAIEAATRLLLGGGEGKPVGDPN